MRLIDADALIPMMKYTTTDNEIGVFPIRIGFDAIRGVIDNAPTIDAVEVVRCKDCRWYDNKYGDVCHNPRYGDGHANYSPPYVDEEYWCKDGERKEL